MFGRCQCTAPTRREADVCRPDDLVRPPPLFDHSSSIVTDRVIPTTTGGEEEREEETGKRIRIILNYVQQSKYQTYLLPFLSQGVEIAWLKRNETRSTPAAFLPTDSVDSDDTIVVEAADETEVTNGAWISSGKERERQREKNKESIEIYFSQRRQSRRTEKWTRQAPCHLHRSPRSLWATIASPISSVDRPIPIPDASIEYASVNIETEVAAQRGRRDAQLARSNAKARGYVSAGSSSATGDRIARTGRTSVARSRRTGPGVPSKRSDAREATFACRGR